MFDLLLITRNYLGSEPSPLFAIDLIYS